MSEVWQISSLGKHCYIKARIGWRGLSASEYTEDGPYLIAGKHVDNGVINWEKCDHITNFRYRESWEIVLKDGDVILTKDGTIGRVARIDKLPSEATINGTMMLLRPKATLDYRFLYHVLNGQRFKKLVEDKVSGSSIPHIFQRDMVTLSVSFPPLDHQKQIADILDTLDTTTRQTEAIIAKLKQVKQGLLHDLLIRGIDANGQLRPPVEQAPHLYKESPLGWVPREWEVVTLGEVAKRSNGLLQTGPFGSQLHAHDYVTEGVPVIMPQDMVDGLLSEAQIARISERKANVLSRHRVKENDVVFSRRGDLSRCVAIPTEKNGWLCGTGCLLARFSPKEINGYWLSLVYQQPQLQPQVMGRAVGSTLANLNTSILSELVIGRSSIDDRNEIARQVNAANQRLTEENRKLRKLHKQKSALMDDLLTGRVRVTALLSGETPVPEELERESA